jgi:hypothetical protein
MRDLVELVIKTHQPVRYYIVGTTPDNGETYPIKQFFLVPDDWPDKGRRCFTISSVTDFWLDESTPRFLNYWHAYAYWRKLMPESP